MIAIRPRREDDLARCVEILVQVHRADRYPVVWPPEPTRWLTPRNLRGVWVAEHEGRVVGHVAACDATGDPAAGLLTERTGLPTSQMAVVSRLFVDPAARGLEVGGWLMATVGMYAREHDLRLVLGALDVHTGAAGFYDRLGWRRLGTVDFTLSDGSVRPMHCYTEPDALPRSTCRPPTTPVRPGR
ncbi:MAG TPA: GNAT family N-acetyltransferase [Micromonospora sp.]